MTNYPDVEELQELRNLEKETERESKLLDLTKQSREIRNEA